MKKVIIISLTLLLLGTLVPLATPAQAAFHNPPGFSVSTTNNVAGAKNAVYTLTLSNLDSAGDFVKQVKIRIPLGYSGNIFLTAPGKLLGSVNVDGFALEIRSAIWSTAVVQWVLGPVRLNVGSVYLNLMTMELILDVSRNYNATVHQAVLNTVMGLFINPITPGTYTWQAWAKGRASNFQPLNSSRVVIVPLRR